MLRFQDTSFGSSVCFITNFSSPRRGWLLLYVFTSFIDPRHFFFSYIASTSEDSRLVIRRPTAVTKPFICPVLMAGNLRSSNAESLLSADHLRLHCQAEERWRTYPTEHVSLPFSGLFEIFRKSDDHGSVARTERHWKIGSPVGSSENSKKKKSSSNFHILVKNVALRNVYHTNSMQRAAKNE